MLLSEDRGPHREFNLDTPDYMDRSIKKAWTAEKLRYIDAFNFRLLKLTAFAWWQCFVSIKFVASILDYFKKLRIEMINTQRNINKLMLKYRLVYTKGK